MHLIHILNNDPIITVFLFSFELSNLVLSMEWYVDKLVNCGDEVSDSRVEINRDRILRFFTRDDEFNVPCVLFVGTPDFKLPCTSWGRCY
jgi:hypothetical protein